MGHSVLSSQFVAGLLPSLKTKVAGVEGDFDQLLVKARFEEAKLKEFATPTQKGPCRPVNDTHHAENVGPAGNVHDHLKRRYPQHRRGAPVESEARIKPDQQVSAMVTESVDDALSGME